MNDLIKENSSLLLTITRFGFALGFGDKTIKEVCKINNVHEHTFMSVVNFVSFGKVPASNDYPNISLESLIGYLKSAHSYFISYKLPEVRKKLVEAISATKENNNYNAMILTFFDDYVKEVQKHMEHENTFVFPYVLKLIEGNRQSQYSIEEFEKNHENIDSKLTDLKNILIKYYPAQGPNYLLNDVLFDLLACEKDLHTHNQVEDYFFVPIVEEIEKGI